MRKRPALVIADIKSLLAVLNPKVAEIAYLKKMSEMKLQ